MPIRKWLILFKVSIHADGKEESYSETADTVPASTYDFPDQPVSEASDLIKGSKRFVYILLYIF